MEYVRARWEIVKFSRRTRTQDLISPSADQPHEGELSTLVQEYATLCKSCKSIINAHLESTQDSDLANVKERLLRISASEGCIFCLLVLKNPWFFSYRKTVRYKKIYSDLVVNNIKFQILHGQWFGEFLFSPSGGVSSIMVDRGSSTGSDGALSVARYWLAQCTSRHPCMRHGNHSLFKPTRLISIGDETPPKLHLSTGADIPHDSKYMTLSHRWGDSMPLKLLGSNISAFRREIIFGELPKTFQEAIIVTHKLEVQYLWIDSLCIIQDSAEDWQKESGLMQSVYSGGFCNLSAMFASSSATGLFSERDPKLLNRKIEVHANSIPVNSCKLLDTGLYRHNIQNAPLNLRAWVFQERLLSKRNLHFGRGQIFWECFEGDACEAFTEGILHKNNTSNKRYLSNILCLNKKPGEENLFTLENWYKLWQDFVYEYSRCALTRPTDRLAAISGLASIFSDALSSIYYKGLTSNGYLAGLWEYGLSSQLLWHMATPTSVTCNAVTELSEDYIAPSWSWASVNCKVFLGHYKKEEITISILSSSVDLLNPHERFGSVTGGEICLLGKLAWASYTASNNSLRINDMTKGVMVKVDVSWDYGSPLDGEFFLLPVHIDTRSNADILKRTAANLYDEKGIYETLQEVRTPWWNGLVLQFVDNLAGSISRGMTKRWRRRGIWVQRSLDGTVAIMRGIKTEDDLATDGTTETCKEVEVMGLGEKAHRIVII